jgi:hypothetical protein
MPTFNQFDQFLGMKHGDICPNIITSGMEDGR